MKPNTIGPIRRLGIALILVLLAGRATPAAQAQPSVDQKAESAPLAMASTPVEAASYATSNMAVVRQLKEQLVSRTRSEREQALQQVIFLAHTQGFAYDFTEAVPELLAIYDRDLDEAYRIMALSALHAIGDGPAMAHLYERSAMESNRRVLVLTLVALEDYYRFYGR